MKLKLWHYPLGLGIACTAVAMWLWFIGSHNSAVLLTVPAVGCFVIAYLAKGIS